MEQFELEIDDRAKANLLLVAQWAKNIAISTLVIIGVLFLGVLFLSFTNNFLGNYLNTTFLGSTFDMGSFSIVVLLLILFAFAFLVAFLNLLLKFSKKLSKGIQNDDINEITEGFKSLKIYLIINGVLVILGLIGDVFSLF